MENNNRILALQWWREMSEEQQNCIMIKHKFSHNLFSAIGASSSIVQRIFENELKK